MRVFLSDLHLEDPGSPSFKSFAELLARESAQAAEIYILGDLTEVWVGDDDDGALAVALKDLLRKTSQNCRVLVMHGNRDFLFGERLAEETGIELIEDPHLLADGTLLAHGDAFCIDDEEYQQVRGLFRSKEWQQDILNQSLEARRELARNLRVESRKTNANKAENIMDVAEREVRRVVEQTGASRLIHGHTHRPGRHRGDWGDRWVLGAWEWCGWLARQMAPGEAPQLECIPLRRD